MTDPDALAAQEALAALDAGEPVIPWDEAKARLTANDECNCFPHGPDEPCTCDGCWACAGHVVGCTCDVAWDCEHRY